MRIDGSGRIVANPARGGGKTASGGAVFAPEAGGTPARQAGALGAPASMAGIDALLALQAVEDPLAGRKRAVRRAGALLDTLEDIRADLLCGGVGEGRLNRAVALLQQARDNSEPGLAALVADIELRVRVELAKLGRFPAF